MLFYYHLIKFQIFKWFIIKLSFSKIINSNWNAQKEINEKS
jgi:hypothetical protein